jgi:hypothetical protein
MEERLCPGCGVPLPPAAPTGRPRRWCSESCLWRQPRPIRWHVPQNLEEPAEDLARIREPFA